MNFFGTPTMFLHGLAANKFIYTCDGNTLVNQHPLSPELLKQYAGKIDEEVRKHFEMHWHGKQKISAMLLMKTLTFNILSSLIIGIEQVEKRDVHIELFQQLLKGVLSNDLASIKYTWKEALESLRIMSPVFISFRRVVKDLEYEGYLIPKGWQVAWSACMTHMNECIFPDPSKFEPRHFKKSAFLPPYSFVA
ncbi:PREDICTED: taxoid 7-beta-hydroxylase-like [Populus euphratica]|uniref:Taxoid 7-beta-hydroxylase-like n=1 Tax=Populus euphratica TaxID=75702 RepID=A0AAJ6VHS5_POPEU|nr:PREDICTED: taxoid 7-beta-hydroxylase-like [Populus euphratica]